MTYAAKSKKFILTMEDVTKGWTKTVKKAGKSDRKLSAEAVIEAPGSVKDYPSIPAVNFTDVLFNGQDLSTFNPVASESGSPVVYAPGPISNGTDFTISPTNCNGGHRLTAVGLCSVRRILVEDHGQADDLSVADAEVVRHHQLVGQVGLVVGTVVAGPDDGVAVMVDHLQDLHGDPVADHLLLDPAPDGIDAVDLATGVVDVGVGAKVAAMASLSKALTAAMWSAMTPVREVVMVWVSFPGWPWA